MDQDDGRSVDRIIAEMWAEQNREFLNDRDKPVFLDRDAAHPSPRDLTFDEVTLVGSSISAVAFNRPSASFSLNDVILQTQCMAEIESAERYRRPIAKFLQRLVTAGVFVEMPPTASDPYAPLEARTFGRAWIPFHTDFAVGLGARAFGTPYVAHIFRDVTVRVHVEVDGQPHIASGLVISQDRVLTNAHIVRDGQVSVSWAEIDPKPATDVSVHPDHRIDLAVVTVRDLLRQPCPWLRHPAPAQAVVVLGYPAIPQVEERPLLSFPGNVVSTGPVKTYFGDELMIISAVIEPGASGSPVFSDEGYCVGLVVQQLTGKYEGDDGIPHVATMHAAIPAGVIARELPKLDPTLRHSCLFSAEGEFIMLQDDRRG